MYKPDQMSPNPASVPNERTTPDPMEKTQTPDAVRAARVAPGDKSRTTTQHMARRAPGVDWVRPTDLMVRQSATLAGRGIEFEVELARRTRRLSGQATRATSRGIGIAGRAVSERARRLPDVSEFGRGSRPGSWVSRSGIGLG